MLKREFKEVFKQTLILIVSVFFLIYPIHLIASIFNKTTFVFSEYFLVFYQLFVFFFSFFLGISLFSKEIRNDGFEYLLTLPFSRTKLLLYKIIPRIIALIFLYLIYLVLLITSNSDPFLIAPVSFHAIYFSLFFVSTSLSVLRGNFVGNSIFTGLLFIFFLFATNLSAWLVIREYFGPGESFKLQIFTVKDTFPFNPFSIILLGFLISVPFIISLFHGFKIYDIRKSGKYLKRFITLLVPLVLVGMIFSYFILRVSAEKPWEHYYITEKGVILKYNYSGTFVVSNAGNRKLPDFYPNRRDLYETDKAAYSSVWQWKNNPSGNIEKFDPAFETSENIYSPPEKKFLARSLYGYKDTLIFLESSGKKYSWDRSSENHIVYLDTGTDVIKKYEFPYEKLNLVGVAANGIQKLWVGYSIENMGVTVYTINGTGSIKKILRSSGKPLFVNNVLITFKKGDPIFGRFEDTGYKFVKRFSINDKLRFPFYLNTADLNSKSLKYLYAKIHKVRNYELKYVEDPIEFISIDLNTFRLERFSNENIYRGSLFYMSDGETIFTEYVNNLKMEIKGIFKLKGQRMVLLKAIEEPEKLARSEFGFLGNGFMTSKDNYMKFYTYPDLKEIIN